MTLDAAQAAPDSPGGSVEIQILGETTIRIAGQPVRLGDAKHRLMFAMLVAAQGRLVSTEQVIDQIWGDQPPRTARELIYSYASDLRRCLENRPAGAAEMLPRQHEGGYRLVVGRDSVDLYRFRDFASRAGSLAGHDDAQAVALLEQALSLWDTGSRVDPGDGPFTDLNATSVAGCQWLGAYRQTLREEHRTALITCLEAQLRLGQHEQLTAELADLAAANPLDERAAGLLMIAYYRSARQAEAMRAYQRTAGQLREELGSEPQEALKELYQRILNHDPGLELPAPGHPNATAGASIAGDALRGLLQRSGYRCAFPACRRKVGNERPPCLVPMTTGDPLVLCDIHFRAITEDAAAWPAEALRQMKAYHEQWVELEPGSPSERPPTVLPPQPAPFVGRDADIEALDGIILAGEPAGALVSLYGMPGSGKSALAAWYAHQRAEAFPDGRVYADLADDAGLFTAADLIRSSFRLPGPVSTAGNIMAGLGSRRALLIFDNVPDESTVEKVRAPAPAVTLIASRQGLGLVDAAVAIRVTPLPVEAALDLLAALIGRPSVDADTAAATDIVERCGRLPLALRLAAAQLRRRRWSLRSFADQLSDEVAALQALDLGREETGVWASCLISYRQLGEHTARLFRLIAVSPFEEFDERVAGHLDPDQGAAVLDALLDCHLFEDRGDGRSGMHRLLRGVGRRLYAEGGDDPPGEEVTMLAADLLVAQAEEALSAIQPAADQRARRQPQSSWPSAEQSKRSGAWLAWNRRNLENTLAQLRSYGLNQRTDQFVEILVRLYRMTGDHAAAIGLYENLAGAAPTAKEKLGRLIGLAGAQLAARHAEEAAATLLTAQAVCRQAGLAEPAAIFRMLADVAFQRQSLRHALGLFQTAISKAHEQESPTDAARASNNLGLTHMELGEWAKAEALFQEAGQLFGLIGDRFYQAAAYNNLGLMHYRAGNYAAARAAYLRVLEFYENLGDTPHRAELHNNLGIVCRLLGQPETALTHFGLAILLARQPGDQVTEARATMNAARAHVDLGDADTARTLYEQSRRLYVETSNRVGQAHVADNLAEHIYANDPERALASYEEAISLRRGHIDGVHLGRSLVAAADLLEKLGRPTQARAHREEAVPLLEHTDTTLAEQLKAILQGEP